MPIPPRGTRHGKKVKLAITLAPELHEWLTEQTVTGGRYASMSHAIERALVLMREREG